MSCGGVKHCDVNVTLGSAWLKTLLQPAVDFSRRNQVPMWIDQWGIFATAGTCDADRASYLSDVLSLFGEAGLHWAMWIWRRPLCGQDGYSICCENEDGSFTVFETAIQELARWIGTGRVAG